MLVQIKYLLDGSLNWSFIFLFFLVGRSKFLLFDNFEFIDHLFLLLLFGLFFGLLYL